MAATKSCVRVVPGGTLSLTGVSRTRFGPDPPGGTVTVALPLLVTVILVYTSTNGLPPSTVRFAKLVIEMATLLRVKEVRRLGRYPLSMLHWIDCAGGDCPAARPKVKALKEYMAP